MEADSSTGDKPNTHQSFCSKKGHQYQNADFQNSQGAVCFLLAGKSNASSVPKLDTATAILKDVLEQDIKIELDEAEDDHDDTLMLEEMESLEVKNRQIDWTAAAESEIPSCEAIELQLCNVGLRGDEDSFDFSSSDEAEIEAEMDETDCSKSSDKDESDCESKSELPLPVLVKTDWSELPDEDDSESDTELPVQLSATPDSVSSPSTSPRVTRQSPKSSSTPASRVSTSLGMKELQGGRSFRQPDQSKDRQKDEDNFVNSVRKDQPRALGKRKYCFFCKEAVLNISRHLIGFHPREPEVMQLFSLRQSKSRQKDFLTGILKLKCMGNFLHNVEVFQEGRSDIAIAKQPQKILPVTDYLPCLYCYGLYVQQELWTHCERCKLRGDSAGFESNKLLSLSRALLESACLPEGEEAWLREVRQFVLPQEERDDISNTIGKDRLILRFGALLKSRFSRNRAVEISQKLIQLGRLVLALQENFPGEKYLEDFISGDGFDQVVKTSERLGGVVRTKDGGKASSAPVEYLKWGFMLAMVGTVKRGWALKCCNIQDQSDAETFLSRLRCEPPNAVSPHCASKHRVPRQKRKVPAAHAQYDQTDTGSASEETDSGSDGESEIRVMAKKPRDGSMADGPSDLRQFGNTCKMYRHILDLRDSNDFNKFKTRPSLCKVLLESTSLFERQKKWVQEIRKFVQQHMAMDDISKVVEEDSHILFCGALLVKMLGKGRVDEILHSLAFLGMLLLTLQKTNLGKKNLKSFISVSSFDAVMKAAEEVGKAIKIEEEGKTIGNETQSLEVGYMLAFIATVKRGRALVCGNKQDQYNSEAFLSSLQREQSRFLSSQSKGAQGVSTQMETMCSSAVENTGPIRACAHSISTQSQTQTAFLASSKDTIVANALGETTSMTDGLGLKADVVCINERGARKPLGNNKDEVNTVCLYQSRDKKNYCLYCNLYQTQVSRHIIRQHSEEPEVAELISLKQSNPSAFLKGLFKLRNMGNFLRNVKVIQGEEFGFVVSRRSYEYKGLLDYIPCVYCYAFLRRCDVKRHICDWRAKNDIDKFNLQHSLNRALLESACLRGNQEKWVRDIREFVQQHMAMDDISEVVEEDSHILFCGALLVKMLGKGRVEEISQKLTFLGKLSLTLQTTNPAKENLESFITGQSFDAVLKAAGEISGAVKGNERGQTLEHPSLPFEVGYMLALIATVKKGRALVCKDRHDLYNSEAFLSCLQREQSRFISQGLSTFMKTAPSITDTEHLHANTYGISVCFVPRKNTIATNEQREITSSTDGQESDVACGRERSPPRPAGDNNNRTDILVREKYGISRKNIIATITNAPREITISNDGPDGDPESGAARTSESAAKRPFSSNNCIDIATIGVPRWTSERRQYCLFCEVNVTSSSVAEHFASAHVEKLKVAQLACLKRSGKQKDYLHEIHKLRCLGNFMHNLKVLQGKTLDFVVCGPLGSGRKTVSTFLPCLYCYECFTRHGLHRHTHRCELKGKREFNLFNNNKNSLNRALLNSAALAGMGEGWSGEVREFVQEYMTAFAIHSLIREDTLILCCGAVLIKEHGKADILNVFQSLMLLGRLLVLLQEKYNNKRSLNNFVSGECCGGVIKAAQMLGGSVRKDGGGQDPRVPSKSLQLPFLLAMLGTVKRGWALGRQNKQVQSEAEAFLSYLHSKQPHLVSSEAASTSRVCTETSPASFLTGTISVAANAPRDTVFPTNMTRGESIAVSTNAPRDTVFPTNMTRGESIAVSTNAPRDTVFPTNMTRGESIAVSTNAPRDTVFPTGKPGGMPFAVWVVDGSNTNSTHVDNVSPCLQGNKNNPCPFCKGWFVSITQHIAKHHPREPEVAKLLPLEKSKSGHTDFVYGMDKLKNLGNFLEKVDKLRGEESHLLVAKQSTVLRRTSDQLPCLYCYGFYGENALSQHSSECATRDGGTHYKFNKMVNKAFIEAACLFGRVEELSRYVRDHMQGHFAQSELSKIVEEDNLILCYSELCKRTLDKESSSRISLELTLLGKLLLTLKERQPTKTSLGSFISDACFYDVLEAAETLCGMSIIGEGQKAYKARMSFHTLRSVLVYVGIVKRAWALVARDKQSQLDSEGFLSRLHCEWPEAHPSHPEKSVPSLEQTDKTVQPSRSETALSVSSGNLTSPLLNVDALCSAAAANFIPPTASTNTDFVNGIVRVSSDAKTNPIAIIISPTASANSNSSIGSTGVSSVASTNILSKSASFNSRTSSVSLSANVGPAIVSSVANSKTASKTASFNSRTNSVSSSANVGPAIVSSVANSKTASKTASFNSRTNYVPICPKVGPAIVSSVGGTNSGSHAAAETKNMAVQKQGLPVGYHRDERLYCWFCSSYCFSGLHSHIITFHANEPELRQLIPLRYSTSNDRFLQGMQRLRYLGNFVHNLKVLRGEESGFIVASQGQKVGLVADYLPCLHCYGFFYNSHIYRHYKKCDSREVSGLKNYCENRILSEAMLESACLLLEDEEMFKEVREFVLPQMAGDLGDVVKGDKLILGCGALYLMRVGKERASMISQKLTKLGRLLQTLQETGPERKALQDFVTGDSFDQVIKAAENLCGLIGTRDGGSAFMAPSFAHGLGFLLAMVGNVKRGWALQCQNRQGLREAEAFLLRLQSDSSEVISERANVERVCAPNISDLFFCERTGQFINPASGSKDTYSPLVGGRDEDSVSLDTNEAVSSRTSRQAVSLGTNDETVSLGLDSGTAASDADEDIISLGANKKSISSGMRSNTNSSVTGSNYFFSSGSNDEFMNFLKRAQMDGEQSPTQADSTTSIEGTGSESVAADETEATTSPGSQIKDEGRAVRTDQGSYKRKNYCLYCKAPFRNITEHLSAAHPEESEILKVSPLKQSNPAKFLYGLYKLRIIGNFQHNLKFIQVGGSELSVAKQSRHDESCLPCLYCYGFYSQSDLQNHMEKCDDGESSGLFRHVTLCKVLMESACLERWSRDCRDFVFPHLARSGIQTMIMRDRLILRLGGTLLKRFGKAKAVPISQKMIQLGKLLLILKKSDPSKKELIGFISGDAFGQVKEAAKQLHGALSSTGPESDRQQDLKYSPPVLRVVFLLAMVGNVKRGWALQCGNRQDLQDAELFLSCLRREWSQAVSISTGNSKCGTDNQVPASTRKSMPLRSGGKNVSDSVNGATFPSLKRKAPSSTEGVDTAGGEAKVRKRAFSEKRKWTTKELSIIKQTFGDCLNGNFYPSGRALQDLIDENPCLKDRTVAQMRSKIQHLKRGSSDT